MPTFMPTRKCFALLATPLLAFSLTILLSVRTVAQSTNASVSGRVTDQSNAVVPNVEVEMKNVDTGLTQVTKTNGDGIYSFPALPAGNYVMSIRKEQFQTVSVTGIALHTQDSLSRNFVLQVGSSAVSITVSAADAMWATTDSPAVSTLVTREFVQNMPLNGRSFQDLIALAPGTVSSANGNGLFSVNGQRDDANYFMVDGVGANIYSGNQSQGPYLGPALGGAIPAQTVQGTTQALLSVDSLEEFRIQTSGYTAEFGRQPGGEVQLTSRSGTNEWHGTAFDYLRNTVFDANSWFNNANGLPRGVERQNDFGGTFGGPVVLPRLYNGKDRTFLFFSYEGLRLLLPTSNRTFVPTVALRQAAAPGLQPFLNAFPLPNGSSNTTDGCTIDTADGPAPCDAELNVAYSNPSRLDAISVRIDQQFGKSVRLFGRFADTPSSRETRTNPQSNLNKIATNTRGVTLGATAIIRTNLFNDFRFNYSESNTSQAVLLDNFGGAVPFPLALLVPGNLLHVTGVAGDTFFCLSNSFCTGPGVNNPLLTEQHQLNVVDGLSWTRGSHTLKFGIDYRRLRPLIGSFPYSPFLFVGSVSDVQQGTADDSIGASNTIRPKIDNLSLYAQDHWKLTSRFTLDYGLRWEFNPVPTEASNLEPIALTQANDLSNLQVAPPGTPVYHTQYRNFAPRVGFAWNVRSSQAHALVLRGGFGIYYDTGAAQWAFGFNNGAPPFNTFVDAGTVSLPLTQATFPAVPLIPSVPTPPYSGFGLSDPNLKVPYTEQYNLSADLGLTQKNTVTLSYVGNQGHRLLESQTYSQIPNFFFFTLTSNASSSSYNALQILDRGYLAPGLQVIASYTWAHAMDNVSSYFIQSSAPIRGNSDNDIRQALNLALNYEIPGASSSRFLRALTRGWVFGNRFVVQSGYPFNVIQGQYVVPTTHQKFNIYPDLIPGVPIYLRNVAGVPDGWELNAAAFSPVPLSPDGSPVRQGDVPRNFTRAPGFWNLNTALERSFPIHESLRLAIRVEAFNVFNHSNFTSVDSFIGDPTFGQLFGTQTTGVGNQLYATGSPRSLQFMLKLTF